MNQENQNKINVQIQHELDGKGKSKLRQYQDLMVGNRSILFLIKYELIGLFFSRIPGALGLLSRQIFYPMILKKVGRGVAFGMDVWFRHPEKIEIGDGAILDDGALLDAKGSNNIGINIGQKCYIGRGAILSCKNGDIVFEDYVNISTYCNISSNAKITIGKKTLLGPFCTLFATSHNFDTLETSVLDQGWSAKGVVIGKNCWLGAHVSVLDGVSVGQNTVIGAGAIVRQNLPENVIAVGVPAKVVKKRK